jgi:hypothetical protein
MVRMQSFLRCLADLDGRKPDDLEQIALMLRAADLISPSRRGKRCSLRFRDASALLIAAMMGETPIECPRAVGIYSNLVHHSTWGYGAGFPSLKDVQACDYFSDALEMLLCQGLMLKHQCLATLSVIYGAHGDQLEEILAYGGVEIRLSLWKPVPRAVFQMRLHDQAGILLDDIQIEWHSPDNPDPLSARTYKQTEISITGRAIFELAELLHGVEQQPDLWQAA